MRDKRFQPTPSNITKGDVTMGKVKDLATDLELFQKEQHNHNLSWEHRFHTLGQRDLLGHLLMIQFSIMAELNNYIQNEFFKELMVEGPQRHRMIELSVSGFSGCSSILSICNVRLIDVLKPVEFNWEECASFGIGHLGRFAKTMTEDPLSIKQSAVIDSVSMLLNIYFRLFEFASHHCSDVFELLDRLKHLQHREESKSIFSDSIE